MEHSFEYGGLFRLSYIGYNTVNIRILWVTHHAKNSQSGHFHGFAEDDIQKSGYFCGVQWGSIKAPQMSWLSQIQRDHGTVYAMVVQTLNLVENYVMKSSF